MGTHILLINGPPRSGKDTFAEAAENTRVADKLVVCKFATALKEGLHVSLGASAKQGADHFEDCKDEPSDTFNGLTPRQAYIYHSEQYMKPQYGDHIFAKILLIRILEIIRTQCTTPAASLWVLVPDCGFPVEAEYLTAKLGRAAVNIVRLYREGCDFSNDSRDYLSPGIARSYELTNSDIYKFKHDARLFVELWQAGELHRW